MDMAKKPTMAKPGSEEKILILAARYEANLPLWLADDCIDPDYKIKSVFETKKRKAYLYPSKRDCQKAKRRFNHSSVEFSTIQYCDYDLIFDDVAKAYEEI